MSTPRGRNSKHTVISASREKPVEHILVRELLKRSRRRGNCSIEMAKPEVDRAGYPTRRKTPSFRAGSNHDLIGECNGHVRHIRLMSSYRGSRTARQAVNLLLAEKPSGCVVWVYFDSDSLELGTFLFLVAILSRNCRIPILTNPQSTPREMRRASRPRNPTTGSSTKVNSRRPIQSEVSGITSSATLELAGGTRTGFIEIGKSSSLPSCPVCKCPAARRVRASTPILTFCGSYAVVHSGAPLPQLGCHRCHPGPCARYGMARNHCWPVWQFLQRSVAGTHSSLFKLNVV